MSLNDLSISVIIPVHNGGDDFRRCLRALSLSLDPPLNRELQYAGAERRLTERRSAIRDRGDRNLSREQQKYANHRVNDRHAVFTLEDAALGNEILEGSHLESSNLESSNLESSNLESNNSKSSNSRSNNSESSNSKSNNLESNHLESSLGDLSNRSVGNRPVEIIVVSDGDSDGSWRLAEAYGTRLIRLPQSGGPAKARNIGAKSASGDILFFVDADVEVHPDTLSKVVRSFEANPNLAALIGSYDDAPGAPNFLSQYKNLIHHYTHQKAPLEASTFWGACGAVRRHVFEEVGGFDESYRRPCIEDIELGYRLKYAGCQIQLRSDIWVKHLKRWTPKSLLRADIFYRALPWTDLLRQVQRTKPIFYRRFTRELNLDWRSKASVVLVFGLTFGLILGLIFGLASGLMLNGFASWATPNPVTGFAPAIFGCQMFNWQMASWLMVLLCGVGLLLLNLPVYQFFYRKRGWLFALKTVPWHWLYFLYSGLVYAYTAIRYRLRPG